MCTKWWKNLFKPNPEDPVVYSEKVALLFGIDDYPGTVNDLSCCVNDVDDWEYKLKMNWPEVQIRKFINKEATKERFKTELRNAIAAMPIGSTIAIFSDSCFSGDNTKDGNPHKRRIRFIQPNLPPRLMVRGRVFRSADMKWLAISTSGEHQVSEEAEFNGRGNGVGSFYALRCVGPQQTWQQFYNCLHSYIPSTQFPQCPEFSGLEYLKLRKMFEGPTLFVVNSSHGSYTYDIDGDEADGYDEMICFYNGNVIDDELNVILQTIH